MVAVTDGTGKTKHLLQIIFSSEKFSLPVCTNDAWKLTLILLRDFSRFALLDMMWAAIIV